MATNKKTFQPEYYEIPGKFLEERLESGDISKADLARRCDRPLKTISEILKGSLVITPETALQFEKVLNIPAARWLELETVYQLQKAESKQTKRYADHIEWAKKFPLTDLRKRGFISNSRSKTDTVESLLKFLGAGSPEAWNKYVEAHYAPALFRRSTKVTNSLESIVTWLRMGELEAQKIQCAPYNAKKFKQLLSNVRRFFGQSLVEFEKPLQELCATAGVAVVVQPSCKGAPVSGAARWQTKDKAILQLSNRLNKEDIFWFSFFHEACHILYHAKKETFIDLEDNDYADSDIETEANDFAQRTLIPKRFWSEFESRIHSRQEPTFRNQRIWRNLIGEFAVKYDITPGILLGQIRRRFEWGYGGPLENMRRKIDLN